MYVHPEERVSAQPRLDIYYNFTERDGDDNDAFTVTISGGVWGAVIKAGEDCTSTTTTTSPPLTTSNAPAPGASHFILSVEDILPADAQRGSIVSATFRLSGDISTEIAVRFAGRRWRPSVVQILTLVEPYKKT